MNINILEENTPGKTILDTVADVFDLHHLHNTITCVKSIRGSSIDILMTNKPTYFMHSLAVETGLSDFHKMIITYLKRKIIKNKPKLITYRKMKNFNTENFMSDFNALNFSYDEIRDDPDKIADDFCFKMQNILNKHAPIKQRMARGNNAAFVNKDLRKAIMKRSQLRNKHNKNKSEDTWKEYKKQRNKCTKIKIKAKKSQFTESQKHKPTDKNFWNTFKPYITDKAQYQMEDYLLEENNKIINNTQEITTIFNEYFTNIIEYTTGKKHIPFKFQNDQCNIEQIINHYKDHVSIQLINQHHPNPTTFDFDLASEENIENIIKSLNPDAASGVDKTSVKILKLTAKIIKKPLKSITNSTITQKKYVERAKEARITPLFKKNSKLCKKNFRPVSVLNSFSKIIEKHYQNSMRNFTDSILSEKITAYRKGHSCHHVLLSLTEEWREFLDKNMYVGAVIMDLSKAFDCLPHELLIAKLNAYGMSKKSLKLIYSYLINRKQRVEINGIFSEWQYILTGVPQGSILGPILFNIFFNDFIYYIKSVNPHNFADDNNLSAHAKDINKLVEKLQLGTSEAVDWLEKNCMLANPDKFKSIILHKTYNIIGQPIKIKNEIIKSDQHVKSLGITIDNKLNYKKHITKLCKTASAKLNALRRNTKYLNFDQRKYFVHAYVLSTFNYSNSVWHFCGLTETHKMEKIQERAIRFIYNDYDSLYAELLIKYNISTLYTKRVKGICTEMYKTTNNLNPGYMKKIFQNRPSTHPSRQPLDLYISRSNQYTYGENCLRILGPKLWNSIPNDTRKATNINAFKNLINNIPLPHCKCNGECIIRYYHKNPLHNY